MILVNFCYESPKYLLLNQGSAKAIEVLKRVYVLNTGKTIESFPVRFQVNLIIKENQRECRLFDLRCYR